MNARWSLGVLVVAAGLPALHAEAPVETGLQAEVLIKLPTRLDWGSTSILSSNFRSKG